MAWAMPADVRPGSSSSLAPTSSSSGPMCWVRMWMRRRTWGVPSMAAWMRRRSSGVADSPISSPFISTTRMRAMVTSSPPIARVAGPSQRGSSSTTARVTPVKAKTRPKSAPRSSSSTTGSSGLLERRM